MPSATRSQPLITASRAEHASSRGVPSVLWRDPMADIALLVAEEFEKRVKRGGQAGGGEASESGSRSNFGAVAKVWGSWVESAAAATSGVRVAVQLRKLEPKTGLGLAAFDGLFSA